MSTGSTHSPTETPPVVALAGWLVPGAGYWLIGQRGRAVTCGVTIIAVFLFGILISGIRVVQAPDFTAPGNPMQRVLTRPWFIGQALCGPMGIGAAYVSDKLAHSQTYGKIEAKARLAEIGTLYTAIAGMLNLLTIIDAASRAADQQSGDPGAAIPPAGREVRS